jgi:uncharacterized protein
MDWHAFEKEVKDLSTKINYHPDIIIGITRGGIIPARLLSSYLKVKDMHCISVRKIGEERVVTEIYDNLKSKKVLLVEDMLETGRSLIIAKKYLEYKGAKVKTACLYVMPISKITPDFFLRQVKRVEKFPWE